MIATAIASAAFLLFLGARAPEDARTGGAADELLEFEQRVLPILQEHCFECHGPAAARPKGGLRIRGRAALLEGGELGPALVPGDPEQSLLVRAIRWTDDDLKMPPRRPLEDEQIAALVEWVRAGAPWPAIGEAAESAPPRATDSAASALDRAAARAWWSFQPVARPAVPAPADGARAQNEIDAFVQGRLAAAGLALGPEADRRTLARRLWFVLLGLPPSFEELEAFAADARPDAYQRLVDALLARPEYGERWARHWLDVVRYAETCGFERDQRKLYAWRYRDWVIDAFNSDLPFDRFVRAQVAGDELDVITEDSLVATGFYRLGPWDSEPDDPELAEYDERDDVVRAIGEGFLGITIGCARCHDHKFDPFPQEDYYGLLAFVRNVRPFTEPELLPESAAYALLGAGPREMQQWQQDLAAAQREADLKIRLHRAETKARALQRRFPANRMLAELLATPAASRTDEQHRLAAEIDRVEISEAELHAIAGTDRNLELRRLVLAREQLDRAFAGALDWALVVKEAGPRVPPTRLLIRGAPGAPGAEVVPHFPFATCASDAAAIPEPPIARGGASSGRRRVLADWIASPENPLTARVIANRVWHHAFGRGLVATPNDFGRAGELPSHPELLDWLAAELVANGWSLKHLQRLILTSATWRQASSASDAAAERIDPDNRLLWRQNRRRLEAEAVRDSILAVSGTLAAARGGPSFFEPLERSVLAGSSRPGEGWGVSPPEDCARRSIYGYAKRNLALPLLEVFDSANSCLSTAARTATTVPTQALTLFNGAFAGRQARAFAARIEAETRSGGDVAAAVRRAFEHALQRRPAPEEERLALDYLRSAELEFAAAVPQEVIEARIPSRVEVDFLGCLGGRERLRAPALATVAPGRFFNEYNKTREVDPLQGPAALFPQLAFGDGTLRARLKQRGDAPFASLLLRASARGDVVEGVEVRMDRDATRILLHGGAEATRELARAEPLPDLSGWTDLRILAEGARIEVFAGGAAEPLAVAADAAIPSSGACGIRTWGDGVALQQLEVASASGTHSLPIADEPAARRALEALALALLNSSEFITAD